MIETRQVTLSATQASPLATGVQGPSVVANHDAAIAIFVGAKGVTATTGLRVAPNQAVPLPGQLGDDVYAVAASGTPVASILLGR